MDGRRAACTAQSRGSWSARWVHRKRSWWNLPQPVCRRSVGGCTDPSGLCSAAPCRECGRIRWLTRMLQPAQFSGLGGMSGRDACAVCMIPAQPLCPFPPRSRRLQRASVSAGPRRRCPWRCAADRCGSNSTPRRPPCLWHADRCLVWVAACSLTRAGCPARPGKGDDGACIHRAVTVEMMRCFETRITSGVFRVASVAVPQHMFLPVVSVSATLDCCDGLGRRPHGCCYCCCLESAARVALACSSARLHVHGGGG